MLKELRDSYLSLRKDYHDLVHQYREHIRRVVGDRIGPGHGIHVYFFSAIKAGVQFDVIIIPPRGRAMAWDIKRARIVIPHNILPNDLNTLDWSPVLERRYSSDQEARTHWWTSSKDKVFLHPPSCVIGD